MDHKLLATQEGILLLESGDTFTLTATGSKPDLFDIDLIDALPKLRPGQRLIGIVSDPVYEMFLSNSPTHPPS
ncbi:MAG: hypothetical protein CMI01_18340 [Oceanospirillaceae bacterium]|nr:hypothetical protein [Oceanospirillaceae bacterium]